MQTMKKHANRILLACIAGLALLASCGDDAGDGEPGLPFEPAGPDSAPDPMQPGPFPVGVQTFTVDDHDRLDKDTGEPRRLLIEVWYPAVQAARDEPKWTYDPVLEPGTALLTAEDYQKLKSANLPGMTSWAVRDAAIDSEHGPYPLMLYSHGSYSIRWQSPSYTAQLASHGAVVVACDHPGNTLWDMMSEGFSEGSIATEMPKRLVDMVFKLDWFLDKNNDAADFFHGSVDPERIGVSGHSFGGFTAAAVPCLKDIRGRVKMTIPHSPIISPASMYCEEPLDQYPVPMMVMGGTLDVTVPWKHQYCEYNLVTAPSQYLYEVEGGGHYTFTDICSMDLNLLVEEFDFGAAEDALKDGCSPTDNVDWHDAVQTYNHYATAFFNLHLRGSTASRDYLVERGDPPFDTVNFYEGHVPDWPDGGCAGD